MKQKYILILFTLFFGCQSASQLSTDQKPNKEKTLFTVANNPVTSTEFIYAYEKNNINTDSTYTRTDITDYLELYKKFKLKIAEAQDQGLDSSESFLREFNTYKEQLKKPYLTATKVADKLISEAYDRYKSEIKASHILIQITENAAPEDTLAAYDKIQTIKKEAENGGSFDLLAKKYSEDPSAKRNGGNLGYFTSFQMVYPFESAAYNTPEGEISKPVRTKFGYHILKVFDKRPSSGTITVSHLMLRNAQNKADSMATRNKIFELYEQATGGANWEQLVEQFSEDLNSKSSGGLLQPFGVGKMPYEFQEAAIALNEIGDFSDPIKTPYGWHIIRLEERNPLQEYSEMKASIETNIKRDVRAEINRKVLVNRLKEENNFKLNVETKSEIMQYADSTLNEGVWSYPSDLPMLNNNLFSIEMTQYTVKNFFDFVVKTQKKNQVSPVNYMQTLYNQYEENQVVAYEEEHLEDKYIDYRMLVKEYREGIMLFQLMEDEVWQKAVEDTVGLRTFYNNHLEKYQWKQRTKATIYNSANKTVINEIKEMIALKDTLVQSKKALENKYNKQTALTLQVESGKYESGENKLIDSVDKSEGIKELSIDSRFILVHVEKILPSTTKPFEKIKGLVISDYQNQLEKEWLEQLKLKYPVEVNKEELEHVYKTLISK